MLIHPTLISILGTATDMVWPRNCLVCGLNVGDVDDGLCFCSSCRSELTTDPFAYCPRCTSSVGPHVDLTDGCVRCQGEKHHFSHATRLGVYDGQLREAVVMCKQPGGENLAESLGILWGTVRRAELTAYQSQVIVPVPLHWTRWWQRGFNQSELIARGLSTVLGIPVMSGRIRRTRQTPHQTFRTREERKRNVDGAFRVRGSRAFENMRVLLIDDVLTTGATADAVSQVIRDAGATEVDLAVLAHR